MRKSVDETVTDYFSSLLTESSTALPYKELLSRQGNSKDVLAFAEPNQSVAEPKPSPVEKEVLTRLLSPLLGAQETVQQPVPSVAETSSVDAIPVPQITEVKATELEGINSDSTDELPKLQSLLPAEFQSLCFDIAGLTLAVPLQSLSGIVRLGMLNKIVGRPSWYLGMQEHRGKQLNIVDPEVWMQSEHIGVNEGKAKNYQYVLQLGDSQWGLACESLVETVRMDQSQVSWRIQPQKRPWLAGVVKEKMCGMLNVQVLVAMLDAGLGCQDQIG